MVIVAAAFVVSRAIALWAGMRYLDNESGWLVQLLDLDILQHHLLRALFDLHAQPPLFNLLIGLSEKLAGHNFGAVMYTLQLLLGISAGVAVYLTLVVLDVAPLFSLLVSLFLLLNPTAVLFEFDGLYTSIVYASLSLISLAIALYVRTHSRRSLYTLTVLLVLLTLLRSSYHWIWLIAIFALLYWQLPEERWKTLKMAAVGLFIALLWPAKNYLLFRHFTSSTWGPYSLCRLWEGSEIIKSGYGALPDKIMIDISQEQSWIRDRWQAPATGLPELDDIAKSGRGATNWNSLSMLRMHDAQAKDVVYLMRHDPGTYLHNVLLSALFFFEPSTNYFTLSANLPFWEPSVQLERLASPVDDHVLRVCCYVFGVPPKAFNVYSHTRRDWIMWRLKSVCVGEVLMYTLVLACILSFWLWPSLWSSNPCAKAATMPMAFTILYLFLIVSFFEIGENMRFRFETQALVFIVAAVFCQQLGNRWQALRRI